MCTLELWQATLSKDFFELRLLIGLDEVTRRHSIFEYLEVFYNRQRLHSSLGYVSPVMYEQQVK